MHNMLTQCLTIALGVVVALSSTTTMTSVLAEPNAADAAPVTSTPESRLRDLMAAYKHIATENEETKSGHKSDTRHTAAMRKKLSQILKDPTYAIKSVLDLGCGDFMWQALVPELVSGDITYTGVDIVAELQTANTARTSGADRAHVSFITGDLLNADVQKLVFGDSDTKKSYDLVIVRDVIQHIPLPDAKAILQAVDDSGSRYIFTTFHRGASFNNDAGYGGDSHHDVKLKPFNFDDAVAGTLVQEHAFLVFPENAKGMGLWTLPALRPDPEPVARKRRFKRKKKKKGKKGKKKGGQGGNKDGL